ncbi:hypothetical protein C8E87_3173 [Paractinoplanes brasiliensis]|uniref:Uncharacterized protein n=1 Tax=Paractinoplanes brasiliensis TaxID=52695 RepID=A0A4R6JS36_9ACTN|nr:hypothetical protein C8E87_3173 [Actinoplanes brasiliensis]
MNDSSTQACSFCRTCLWSLIADNAPSTSYSDRAGWATGTAWIIHVAARGHTRHSGRMRSKEAGKSAVGKPAQRPLTTTSSDATTTRTTGGVRDADRRPRLGLATDHEHPPKPRTRGRRRTTPEYLQSRRHIRPEADAVACSLQPLPRHVGSPANWLASFTGRRTTLSTRAHQFSNANTDVAPFARRNGLRRQPPALNTASCKPPSRRSRRRGWTRPCDRGSRSAPTTEVSTNCRSVSRETGRGLRAGSRGGWRPGAGGRGRRPGQEAGAGGRRTGSRRTGSRRTGPEAGGPEAGGPEAGVDFAAEGSRETARTNSWLGESWPLF